MSRYEPDIFDPEAGRDRPAHDVIWERAQGMKLPKGWVVHHADGNGHNNNPGNLIALPRSEHIKLHAYMRRRGIDPVDANDKDVIASRKSCSKYNKSHKDALTKAHTRYVERNREKILNYYRDYNLKNKEKRNKQSREYNKTHKDAIATYMADFQKKYQPIMYAKKRLRYAIKRGFSEDEIDSRRKRLDELKLEMYGHT